MVIGLSLHGASFMSSMVLPAPAREQHAGKCCRVGEIRFHHEHCHPMQKQQSVRYIAMPCSWSAQMQPCSKG